MDRVWKKTDSVDRTTVWDADLQVDKLQTRD